MEMGRWNGAEWEKQHADYVPQRRRKFGRRREYGACGRMDLESWMPTE
jgi:hypothetical protein